ncbi:nuclear pore complex protein DDB_G0274915 isoform X1 [Acyrthosiphon pisum]|uniref:Nucleoporin Nup159/Nup146 N-terminal domain-containing protein n=1 Tax=Acyrthosiphon pisum TaxID=7029 RepID=A0A8R2F969_ACYPI|nr:nuclear pore complex protein DDB_G0274915 isoform X1 [Acyrthosiphon pisum]|eukprot:XP_008183683.1 PREDICTED: nuclear pore complex protein DDB_G0274915 isoform X1 [Acyrthosiphon pisum]
MSTHVKGSCVDVLDFKCSAFCNLRVFNEGHQFDTSTAMVISSNRFGITVVASPNQLCIISMKHVRHLVGDFGVEKNTMTNFLRREIELDYTPNFLDLSCDEAYIAVAGISNSKTSITIYNFEDLISKNCISPLAFVELTAIQESHVIDMSWNPGVQNSLACCLSDGSLHIIELKDGGMYNVVSLPPQSSTLCLSWSPKGKQIIIGSSNGSLTQYKPELKAMKQYLPPTDVTGNVKPIKIKWISNFQFAVVYDFVDNTDNQLNLYILNTPKNAPLEFINFEQYVVMNSEQYRLNQYYTIFQQNWNLLFVASSNCTEIGVMGINNENQWQCWVLETRPELPYRLDKQVYPLGMSLDLSSQMRIKQLSKSNEEIFLEPMPVLCVLSSDGILFMYHIENQLTDYKNICKPPTEISDNIVSQLFTTNSKINNIEEIEQNVAEIVETIDVVDEKARGDHNESVLASYLETSTTSQVEQPQLDTPTISVVKPNVSEVYTETVTPVQNTLNQTNPDKNTSTDETISQVMLKELLEDVQIFQLQLEDILKLSLNTSKLKIGNEKDKEVLMKKWTSLDSFFKELNETNRSQWVESKALQKAVLDSIAWVEDSKSRIFFLKNPKFKCLLRNDSDEPFSKTLFDNIERTLYYIETQLTHVDDQLKARYDSYNPNNKELKIPCLETIYKSLVVNTNIVNKLKEKINFLYNTVEEMKYRTFKKLSLAPDVVQNTSKLNESRDVGLSKLSEQLLKITLDKDGVSAINSYNVAKKYSVLSANQRALSDSKVNKLQEWLKDFKTRRTKITRSQYANIDLSRPVCSTPLKPVSKPKMHEKKNDCIPFVTKDSFVSNLPQPSTLLSKNYNANEQNVTNNNLQSTSQLDLTQFQKPLIIPTTQQINGVTPITVATFTPGISLGSKPLLTNTVWNPMDNSSTPKPVAPNDFSNKFDYKAFTKDPIVFSSVNPLFANNVTSTAVSTKDPVDFSLKSLTATPINFSSSSNLVSNKSTLDIISGTTEAKEKMPFNFSQVSTAKSETTVQKSTGTVNFDFADSIKNKMDKPNDKPLSFETPKPSESSSIFSGFGAEIISKNKQETVPEKDATFTTFKFSSKPTNPDTASFSTFSFNTSKDSVLKTTESETKSSFTSLPTTTVTASFNFSNPPKTVPIVSEPLESSTVSSSFGTVKTALDFSAISTTVESSVTETTSQVSESPTPIISEPITPENEESPKFPVTSSSSQIFEIPTTNISMFGMPNNSTSTTSIFGNSTITTSQASIFSTPTNKTSAPSIFSTPTITDSAPSIFNTPTNTTCAPSIFSTPTSTSIAPSIFGATTSTTNVSSIFGSPSNTSMAPSIFGASSTTTSSSIFGNPIKSTPSIFGTPSTTTVSSMFGSVTTTNTTSGFGSPAQTTTFGAPVTTTNTTSGFGSPAQTTTFGAPVTTTSSIFGNPAAPATTSSSIFGNPANPATTSSSIFGNPSAPASSGSIFGSASTNTSSVFGAPVTTSTTSSIFGSPSTTAASSGLFGSVAAAANQSSFGQPSLGFSSPGSAFGNMSLFGQSACNPSQPANSFAPAANPFAVNKTPSSTPSLFSNQKSVFGQPAASTPNTGFGVPNSGFGATASTGFGSPAMVGQSNNLGFGSPPMFGSMGTTYEKSSGFNQTPVFGGAATFGSTAPTFGQNAGNFGFGSAAQQPSTAFASLATQNTSPSFGNIAQNQNTGFVSPTTPGFGQPQQTSPFKPQGATFGGTSFSSWR